MISTSKWMVIVTVAIVAGSFVASPELRAFAANTVFSGDIVDGEVKTADLANNAVTSGKVKDGEIKTADLAQASVTNGKIKDGEVRAQEIATDAVGAAELQGVSKLIFGSCSFNNSISLAAGSLAGTACVLNGVTTGDKVIVTRQNGGNACIVEVQSFAQTGNVFINYGNVCNTAAVPGTMEFSIIAYLP